MKVRKYIYLIFACILITSAYFAGSIKEGIKYVSVDIYERVGAWSKYKQVEQSYNKGVQNYVAVLDEKLLLNQELVAFTNKLVFEEGEKITLHLAGHRELSVTIFNVNNAGYTTVFSKRNHIVETLLTPVFSTFDGVISPTHQVELNSYDFEPGWIGINVSDNYGNEVEIPVFIDADIQRKKTIFVESTDTLLAYNPAYVKYSVPSFYRKNLDKTQSHIIAHNTPITYNQIGLLNIESISCTDHLINSDAVNKRNLASMGIDFKSVSDEKLDDQKTFENIDALIFGTHNEYWTVDKAVNVMNFIDSGGKVIFLGGNTAWRQVFREADRTWFHGSGLSEHPTFNRLITKYLGSYYSSADYDTYAPANIVNPKFLSERFGINLAESSAFGSGTAFKHCEAKVHGVSGHETDKLFEGAEGFTLLAKGSNEKGGADILYKSFVAGGEVLNFSSMSTWHNKDPALFSLIQSFLEKKPN